MKKSTRFLLWTAAISLSLFFLVRLYFFATDDFRLSNISYEMPYQKGWEIANLEPKEENELDQILSRQFAYIGKGAQSYAFGSDDGHYVIKFFKFKHLRPSWFHAILPSIGFVKEFKEKQAARKRRKLYGVFQGYKTAFDTHKKESGLLFAQLNIQGNPERKVVVRDKIGLLRTIDLQQIPFIIQERGETLRTVIASHLDQGDVPGAAARFDAIFDLYRSEYKKGIYDHDHGVMQNTGFVGNRPIHLDVGKMVREESMKNPAEAKKDLALVGFKMRVWLKRFYPQYASQLSLHIKENIKK